jgi:hypothetical protein
MPDSENVVAALGEEKTQCQPRKKNLSHLMDHEFEHFCDTQQKIGVIHLKEIEDVLEGCDQCLVRVEHKITENNCAAGVLTNFNFSSNQQSCLTFKAETNSKTKSLATYRNPLNSDLTHILTVPFYSLAQKSNQRSSQHNSCISHLEEYVQA